MHLISNARSRTPRRATAAIAALSLGFSLAAAAPARADAGSTSTGASATSTTAAPSPLTPTQASALARQTGKAVPVPAATTGSSTLTANPSGTLTLTQSVEPVRKKVKGTWENLNATLIKNPDGTISPTLSTGGLTLSGGGTGTLATMSNDGQSLALELPTGITLPAPVLDADTATYDSVLTGVNLVVTADAQGGFSEVFVVQNAAAAANPQLSSLVFPTQTSGLTVKSDAAGNLSATDKFGNTLFTAPAATMWDSAAPATSPVTETDPVTGALLDATSGRQLDSTPTGPGEAAHSASLKTTYSNGNITLTPDSSILTGKNTQYPVFVDPTYTSNPTDATAGGGAWTYVSSVYDTTSYYDTTTDYLRSGYTDINDNGDDAVYRSFVQLPVSAQLAGATIQSSTLAFTDFYSNACDDETTGLWQTGAISSGTTWNEEPAWDSEIASASYDYGCSGTYTANNLNFTVTSLMQSAATGHWSDATFGLRAADETNPDSLRHYLTTAQLTTNYDVTPNTPGNLTTSPATTCTGTTLSTVGLGAVNLYANVSSPVGATLNTYFTIWPTAAGSGSPLSITTGTSATSGTTAKANVPESDFSSLTTVTEFSWNVYVKDSTPLTSQPSTTCSFDYDPTIEGEPTVTPVSSTEAQVGTPDSFTVVPGTCPTGKTCSTPTSYTYQLNGAAPLSMPATSGDATITVNPTREANNLTVVAVSTGGNEGEGANTPFTASPSATAPTGALTATGDDDELTIGGQDDLPPGLWLNPATTNTGTVTPISTNIGALGNGISSTPNPASYTGTQAITGYFSQGYGFNDILDYIPSTGAGNLLYGQGDGSALQPVSGSEATGNMQTGKSGDFTDANDVTATYIANGGSLYSTENNGGGGVVTSISAASSTNAEYPDLLLALDGSLIDEPSSSTPGAFYTTAQSYTIANDNPYCLYQNKTNSNTACNTGWGTWQIVTTLVNGLPAMFARDTSTTGPSAGSLWYLSPTVLATLDYDYDNNSATDTAAAPVELATTGWSTTAIPTIQAADFNATPGLYTTSSTGTTTVYTMSGTTITPGTAQILSTATHYWPLNDQTTSGNEVTTAADNSNATYPLPLTGSATGATWNTGDMFTPDIALNGAKDGDLTNSANAVNLTKSFTVSAWTDPTALGGTLLSQSGPDDSGFSLTPTSTGWQFSANTGNGTAATYDTITGGTVQLGSWSHITATFNASTSVMSLYVDDVFVATGTHTAPTAGAASDFVIGANQSAGALGAYYTGQVANVQAWNDTDPTPTQPPTPASYHQALTPSRLLDTRSSLGLGSTSGTTKADTPVGPDSTTTLQIAGDTVTTTSNTPTTIDPSVTAVAIDVTATAESGNGDITAYADGTQRPITSSTNYVTNTTVTGYQIVPVGLDGKIAFYNGGSEVGTTHLIIDITGYFTTNAALAGDQTYTPLTNATRVLDTLTGTGGHTGTVANGASINVTIAGANAIPTTATAVAINLTAIGAAGGGYLQAYATGTTPSNDTALTYGANNIASMAADVPISTNASTNGDITIANEGGASAATNIIGDVTGYYTTNLTGKTYHTANPTRLVDTRSGIGGKTGAEPSDSAYTITQAAIDTVTTTPNATLALMLTATEPTANGDAIVYPDGQPQPTTSNLNWITSQTIANLNLTPISSSTGEIDIYNASAGTTQFVVDCSGYFSTN